MIALTNWDLSMIERDFSAAQKILARCRQITFGGPRSFYEGCTALSGGDTGMAQLLFEKSRSFFEKQVRDHPEVASWHVRLGLAYAYLGLKEDAIRESRRAVDLSPERKDALDGPAIAAALALVYARTGETDQAIILIERLFSTPGAAGPWRTSRSQSCVCVGNGISCGAIHASKKSSLGRSRKPFISRHLVRPNNPM